MSINVRIFILMCSVFFLGCGVESQISKEKVPEKELSQMVDIQDHSLTDKTLTLDYQVTNIFNDDIWVLLEKNRSGFPYAITRIDEDWIWIKQRYCHEIVEPIDWANRLGRGEYLRLAPGESYSGKILPDLPIKDGFRELKDNRKELKKVVAHRIILEVGYFGPQYSKMFRATAERFGIKGNLDIALSHPYIPADFFLAETTRDGQSCEIAFMWKRWPFLRLEESAKDFRTNVDIPCSIVVDDE